MSKERPYAHRWDEASHSLMLEDCNVGDEGMQNLLTWDWSVARKMDLSFNKLTDKSAQLFSNQRWDELISLHWGRNEITDQGVIFLMRVKYPALKSLWLNHNKALGTQSLKAITDNGLPELQTIWLSFNNIGPESLSYFTKGSWDNLRNVHLSGNHFGAEGVNALAQKQWKMLEILQLYDCGLGNEGVMALVKNQWPGLVELHLSNNQIGDDGIYFLVKNEWKSLNILHLSTNPITEKGVGVLLEHPWPSIQKLKMKRIGKVEEEVKKLIRSKFFPHAVLHIDEE